MSEGKMYWINENRNFSYRQRKGEVAKNLMKKKQLLEGDENSKPNMDGLCKGR